IIVSLADEASRQNPAYRLPAATKPPTYGRGFVCAVIRAAPFPSLSPHPKKVSCKDRRFSGRSATTSRNAEMGLFCRATLGGLQRPEPLPAGRQAPMDSPPIIRLLRGGTQLIGGPVNSFQKSLYGSLLYDSV